MFEKLAWFVSSVQLIEVDASVPSVYPSYLYVLLCLFVEVMNIDGEILNLTDIRFTGDGKMVDVPTVLAE